MSMPEAVKSERRDRWREQVAALVETVKGC